MIRAHSVQAWPVVGWRDIVRAYRPDSPVGEAPLKTLRSHGVLSRGLRFTRHNHSRLAGAGMLYSCLSVSAAVLVRRKDLPAAQAYHAHAQRLEDELLKHLSVDRAELEPLAGPSQAAWKALDWLCSETQKALASLPPVPDEERIFGILKSTDGKKVRFVEAGPHGIDRELPYGMLEPAGLSIGDPALLTNEFTGEAIITRLWAMKTSSLPCLTS
jgi:hypothetical protein